MGCVFNQVFVDTNNLKTIYPFGRDVFQKKLSSFNKQFRNLVFIRKEVTDPKPGKRRIWSTALSIAFLVYIGIVAGYLYYNWWYKDWIPCTLSLSQSKVSYSSQTYSKSDKQITIPYEPKAHAYQVKVKTGEAGASRLFEKKVPESKSLKQITPKKRKWPLLFHGMEPHARRKHPR